MINYPFEINYLTYRDNRFCEIYMFLVGFIGLLNLYINILYSVIYIFSYNW